MKRIQAAIAALLATGAVSTSFAQTPDTTVYVTEPVASMAGGAQTSEPANAIVQALNADASLKRSKITVVSDESGITLTGVTPKVTQMARAATIATQHAGEGKVVNAITTEEVFVDVGAAQQPAA